MTRILLPTLALLATSCAPDAELDTVDGEAVKAAKVDVCHVEGDTGEWHNINISVNAVDSHLENHGDWLTLDDEVCGDGVDNDCNGEIDEDCLPDNCVGAEYGGHSYAFCDGAQTRSDSVTWCADELGWELAYVDDEDENSWVVDTAWASFDYVDFYDSFWIANLKSETASTWPSGNAVWASGEPSGDGGYIHILRYSSQPYRWNDVPNGYTWRWICESE